MRAYVGPSPNNVGEVIIPVSTRRVAVKMYLKAFAHRSEYPTLAMARNNFARHYKIKTIDPLARGLYLRTKLSVFTDDLVKLV